MRAPRQDQLLPRLEDVGLLDGARAVAAGLVVEARSGAQGVHQPRLALRLRPHRLRGRRRELLAGLLGVLAHQRLRLALVEVAEAQRLGGDVERAAAGDHLPAAGTDPVVANIPNPAQHDAGGEAFGALLVAGAQLAQHREQGVAHQRIDLVHQQHQRRGVGHAPMLDDIAQRVVGFRCRETVLPRLAQRFVAQQRSPRRHHAENGANARRHVVARHLRHLHVDVDAAVVARLAAVQQVAQSDEGGGLAGLPRRM